MRNIKLIYVYEEKAVFIDVSFVRSINGGFARGSLRYSNRKSSNGGSSSGTIGGGVSDCFFGTVANKTPTITNEESRKYNPHYL